MGHPVADDLDREADQLPALEAALVRHEGEPDELTLYPADAADVELVTHWITAREGGFVDVERWR